MKKIILLILTLGIFGCHNTPDDKPDDPVQPEKVFSTGLVKDPDAFYGQLHFVTKGSKSLPEKYDWREHGGITPVRNQGNCGCCWAFGTTQSHEIGVKIFQKKDIDFSEQQLCGSHFYKCGGGDFDDAWLVKNGQTDEANCKYTATSKACPGNLPVDGKPVASGYVGSPNARPSVEELKQAILSYGAIAVYICGGNSQFMNAGKGLVSGPNCNTDHIVVIMGWQEASGSTYWLVKNSWGTSWADAGYGWIKHGSFNIAERAKWIAVEKVPCSPPALHLPKEYILSFNDDVVLAAKKLDGVTYSWWNGETKLGDGNLLEMVAKESMMLTLKVENSCGKGEVLTRITVK